MKVYLLEKRSSDGQMTHRQSVGIYSDINILLEAKQKVFDEVSAILEQPNRAWPDDDLDIKAWEEYDKWTRDIDEARDFIDCVTSEFELNG